MKRRIVFLEDNRTQILVMKLAFGGFQNVQVDYFSIGKELLNALNPAPDIAIVDLMLPDVDGLELIQTIRKRSPQTKIVVISAQEDTHIIAAVQREGVFNYIVKSESALSYLRQVIEDLLVLLDAKTAKT